MISMTGRAFDAFRTVVLRSYQPANSVLTACSQRRDAVSKLLAGCLDAVWTEGRGRESGQILLHQCDGTGSTRQRVYQDPPLRSLGGLAVLNIRATAKS